MMMGGGGGGGGGVSVGSKARLFLKQTGFGGSEIFSKSNILIITKEKSSSACSAHRATERGY